MAAMSLAMAAYTLREVAGQLCSKEALAHLEVAEPRATIQTCTSAASNVSAHVIFD